MSLILGVDPGFASCGWAVVDRAARVVDLGVIQTKATKGISKRTDRARRVCFVAHELAALARRHHCSAIAAEEPLDHGASDAVAANLMPWGALIGLSVALDIELYEVPAKTWQHAVTNRSGKVDYDALAAQLASYARAHCRDALTRIAARQRTHALDGMGVGMFAALRTATPIMRSGQ